MDIPKDYLCPITHELMENPVLLIEDGRSYEKRALQRWLENNDTSPITNNVLTSKIFVVNISLRNAIEEFREKQFKAENCELLSNALVINTGGLPTELQDSRYPQLKIKICLLGDSAVGKTTLIRHIQFGDCIPKEEYLPTIGFDLVVLHLDGLFDDRYAVTINVWDLPGEMKFRDVWRGQYQCHGAILVCDATTPKSMENIEREWYPRLKEQGFDEFEGVVLCNKIDLVEDYESQIFKDAQRFSSNNNLSLFHTSARTGQNVKAMINQLVLCILNNRTLLAKMKENIAVKENADGKRTCNEELIRIDSNDEKTNGGKTKQTSKNESKKKNGCC